jgi:hypothetical protein
MDPFVNYPQRGIALPAGCKDLMDKLRQQPGSESTQKRIYSEGFEQIPGYVTRLLQSKAARRQVTISCAVPTGAMVVEFGPFIMGYRPSGLSVLMFVDGTDPLLEPAVRAVFEEAGLSAFVDSGVGGGVEPMRMIRYPLPDRATEAARLIADVFRKGFGLSERTRLGFDYYEEGARNSGAA